MVLILLLLLAWATPLWADTFCPPNTVPVGTGPTTDPNCVPVPDNAIQDDYAGIGRCPSGQGVTSLNRDGAPICGSVLPPITADLRVKSLGVGVAADGTAGDALFQGANGRSLKLQGDGGSGGAAISPDASSSRLLLNGGPGNTYFLIQSAGNGGFLFDTSGTAVGLVANRNNMKAYEQVDSGATTRSLMYLDSSNNEQLGGTGITSINANNPVTLPSYTVATLPATCSQLQIVEVTDLTSVTVGACTGGASTGGIAVCSATNTWTCGL